MQSQIKSKLTLAYATGNDFGEIVKMQNCQFILKILKDTAQNA